jgi:hypothetical protein
VTVGPFDRLTVHELAERPPRIAPAVPDLEAQATSYWLGSAGGEVARWRDRALSAERQLEALRGALRAGWRPIT